MSGKSMFRQAGEQVANTDPMARLVVTPWHTQWLEMTEDEQVYSEEAIAMGVAILEKRKKHRRDGRYSPSSIGECDRRVVLGYNGAPQDPVNLDSLDLMSMGTRDHFWWQLEGITMGWMKDAEHWAHDPRLRLGGSLDGVLLDDSVFELKTMRTNLFSRYVLKDNEPKHEHLLQLECYFILTGLTWASLVYQERESGDYHEWRIQSDPERRRELGDILATLDRYVDVGELPGILDKCEMRTGTQYKQCPVRTHCLQLHKGLI